MNLIRFFKPEDFEDEGFSEADKILAAVYANTKLQKMGSMCEDDGNRALVIPLGPCEHPIDQVVSSPFSHTGLRCTLCRTDVVVTTYVEVKRG